ncbi:MAG TPA: LamG domain-containing protein [Stellaceae bacterium]|jgi:hypothetical protein|nr:LamG domain-containing protein [Stellaceae bacterium]
MSQRLSVRDFGTALRFGSATSGKVGITNNTGQVLGAGSASVSLWAKIAKFGDFYFFAMPTTATNNRRYIRVTFPKTIEVQGGLSDLISVNAQSYLNQWCHIVAVFDTTNNMLSLYINGELEAGPTAWTPGTGTSDISIANSGFGDKAFNGLIDEVKIFNGIVLSAADVQKLYYYNQVSATPSAVYLLNEGSGTTALDSSGNGNDGAITGATYTSDVPMKPRLSLGASRKVIGDNILNVNPNMEGTGSTTSDSAWIGANTQGWHTAVSGGFVDEAEYTMFDGYDVIRLSATGLDKNGSSVDQALIVNIDQYTGGSLAASALPYLIPVQAGKQYTLAGALYGVSLTDVRMQISLVYYTAALQRVTAGQDSICSSSTAGSWVEESKTVTAPSGAAYVILSARILAVTDPLINGAGEIYIRKISFTETIPAREMVSGRTAA